MRLTILAGLVAGASLVGTAIAQPPIPDPESTVPHVGFAAIEPVIRAVDPNAQYESIGGVRQMVLKAGTIVVKLRENVCDGAGKCRGLLMTSFLNESASLETINEFNRSTPAARVFLTEDSKVGIMHYLIGDFGVTKGSLIVNIGAFFSAVDKWNRDFSTENLSNVVSFEPLTPEPVPFGDGDAHLAMEDNQTVWPVSGDSLSDDQ